MSTATIYSSSGDGLVRNHGAGSWSSIVSASTGTLAAPQYDPASVQCDGTTADKYNDRGIISYDLSSIPAGANITAATLSLWVTAKGSGAGGAVGITSASPASVTTLAVSDYGLVGSTEYATRKNFADGTTGAYNDFGLNAAGLAYLNSKIGTNAGFAVRGSFDIDNSAPGGTVFSYWSFSTSEQSGTSQDPKLFITYTPLSSRTGADTLAWSDTVARQVVDAGGHVQEFAQVADTLAWSDSSSVYRRSTVEVVVWDAGANTQLSGQQTLGATITVGSTSAFPASGTVWVIDNRRTTQQQAVATYTSKDATHFYGCTWESVLGRSTPADGSLLFDDLSGVAAPDAETHFPQITALDTTERPVLLATAQQHAGHSALRGKLVWKKSYDGGMTWPDSGNIVSSPVNGSNYGVFGHTVCRMKNGRLIATWYEHRMDSTLPDTIAAFKQMFSISDDNGSTWGTPFKLDFNMGYSVDDGTVGFNAFCYTGPGSNATYGDLYLPVYGNADGIQVHSTGAPYRWFTKLFKITDGGAGGAATAVSTMATTAQTGGYANGEAAILDLDGSTWLAHFRVESSSPRARYQAQSTDKGVTWTGHTVAVTVDNGAVLNKLPGGTLVTTGALNTGLSGHAGSTTSYPSNDSGATWLQSAPKEEAYNASYPGYNGSDLVVVIDDPSVQVNSAFIYAQENGSQTGARTMFRWYVDPIRRGGDTLTLSDNAARGAVVSVRSGSDTLTLTDSAASVVVRGRAGADTLSLSDTPARTVSFSRSGTDTLTWTDTGSRSVSFSRTGQDTLTFSDAASGLAGQGRTGGDTLTLSDTATHAGVVLTRTGADTLTWTDSAVRSSSTLQRSVGDTLTWTDTGAIVLVPGGPRTGADTLTWTDSGLRLIPYSPAFTSTTTAHRVRIFCDIDHRVRPVAHLTAR